MALNPNPQEIMERIGVQQTVTSGTVETERARGEMQARTQSGDYIKSMGKELGKLDDANNQAFDTQTLMTAFTDYIAKCEAGGVGVPVNFYLKEIDKKMVAREYIKKFYPNGGQTMEDVRSGILGQ